MIADTYLFRLWRVRPKAEDPHVLLGIVHGQWHPGVNEAVCRAGEPSLLAAVNFGQGEGKPSPPRHRAPKEACKCGIWGDRTLTDTTHRLRQMQPNIAIAPWVWLTPYVIGVIRVWGKLILHTDGVRAEKAQIIAIHNYPHVTAIIKLEDDFVEQVARKYDVPVLGLERLREYEGA